jgi:hypothetical protein
MEIKLTIELTRSKDADRDLVFAVAEEIFRPLVEELKETGSKAAYSLISNHSDWAIKIEESAWDCDSFGDIWECDIKIYLKIIEHNNGNIVDECFAWEMLGAPLYEEVYEPLHSCDWSSLENEKAISLKFSSLKAVHNNSGDGLYFHYEYS